MVGNSRHGVVRAVERPRRSRPSQPIPGVRPTCSECEEGAEQAATDVRAQQNPAARSLETVAIRGFDWAVTLLVGGAVGLTLPGDAKTYKHRVL